MAKTVTGNEEIGEDGLTDHERLFLETPVSELDPQQRLTALSVREKKAAYIWAENELYRREQETSKLKLA